MDSYTWTAHAGATYGRCPDGTGSFAPTVTGTGFLAGSHQSDLDLHFDAFHPIRPFAQASSRSQRMVSI